MANNNIEIEIQVNIENSAPLFDFLKSQGVFVHEVHQVDEYFSPVKDDFLAIRPVSRWLRLRQTEKGNSFNYKNWYFNEDGTSNYCDEFETKIEDINSTRKILKALEFKNIVIVDKLRKIWTFKDYEIAVDSIKGLGDFVEIEYIGNDNNINPKQVTDEMILFLKNLGVGKITRNHVGYPFIMLFPKEVKYQIL
ncbi:MAG: class IV adenylate cyclase [Patescibacteria group bacterium]